MTLHRKKPVRPSRLSINERSFIQAKNEKENLVLQRIANEIRSFDFYQRRDLVRAVAEHPKLPKAFIPAYPNGKDFHGMVNLGQIISRSTYPYWMLGIFNRSHDLLKRFLDLKLKVSGKVLKGDAVGALRLIAQISELSESWWSIETAIHINKELLGNDTKGYIRQLQEAHSNINISGMSRDLLLLSESNSPNIYVQSILGRVKEYQNSGIASAIEHSALESCLLLPIYYDTKRLVGFEALHDYRTWSVIDQYEAFRKVCMELASEGVLPEEWASEANKIANLIDDWELKNVLTRKFSTDDFVGNIIDKYTHGKYDLVVDEIRDAVANESPKVYGLIEIFARAKIYAPSISSNSSFFEKIADELAKILTLDPKSNERAEFIRKISVKFRSEAWAKSLFYHLNSIQEWRSDIDTIDILRRQTICLGPYNTPKAQDHRFCISEFPEGERRLIPRHRVIRYTQPFEKDISIDASDFPIYSDYLKTKSLYLIEQGLLSQALDFSIDEYLGNKVSYDYLPIRQLCEFIEHNDRPENFDYISSLIVLDIYGKETGGKYEDQKTELFEEFLDANDTHLPSKIFNHLQINQQIAYVLRNICVPSQLDNIVQFSSYDEVIHERVSIIDLLITARIGNTEEFRAEKDRVLETLFSEKLRAKIETGKLYVDVQALANDRKHIYRDLFEQAKSLEGGVSLEPLPNSGENIDSRDLLQINDDSPVALAIAASEKSGILVKMFLHAVADFALSENYGLDKYLSAEVRHVVFVTQLRSCFEKLKLVTVQKNGEYLTNTHWEQNYAYVIPGVLSDLNIALSDFSNQIDTILEKVNDRFRVKVADISSHNIFDFCPYHERIVRISEIINSSRAFDEYFSSLIGFMWEIAIENARAAQQLINDVLLVEVTNAIDKLDMEVHNLKGSLPMLDLTQAIRNARSDFQKEVELVLNWFRFVGSEDVQTYERLGVVVEAAVSSFQAVFQHKGKLLSATIGKSDLILNYGEARSLFISLFTALENALRYGSADSPVKISLIVKEGLDEILISNQVVEKIDDPSHFVNEIKSKWTEKYSNLSTAEGGSGFYKIYNLMKNASVGFLFDINISKDIFNVIIGLRHENFINRG